MRSRKSPRTTLSISAWLLQNLSADEGPPVIEDLSFNARYNARIDRIAEGAIINGRILLNFYHGNNLRLMLLQIEASSDAPQVLSSCRSL